MDEISQTTGCLTHVGRAMLSTVGTIVIGLSALALAVLLSYLGAPHAVIVPNVEGQPLEQARTALSGKGLGLEIAGRVYSKTIEDGRVVIIRPSPGQHVKSGRVVQVTVSRGPREIEVPALVGKAKTDAEKTITASHLTVGLESLQAACAALDQVVEQDPAPGKVVGRGETVALVLSGGPTYGAWTDPDGIKHLFRRCRISVPGPEPVIRVRLVTRDAGTDETSVYDRVHQPGDEISVDVVGTPGTRVRLYIGDVMTYETRL